jgi:hypothetical protein
MQAAPTARPGGAPATLPASQPRPVGFRNSFRCVAPPPCAPGTRSWPSPTPDAAPTWRRSSPLDQAPATPAPPRPDSLGGGSYGPPHAPAI